MPGRVVYEFLPLTLAPYFCIDVVRSGTHDFSILSRAEMHRLAAASAAAAILKFSEDPRFASHAAALESSAKELDRRARDGYDAL
jgi:hypothetical protein